tara:strand:+ start:1465 stop:2322 length:858 start_codon:yes stop_codon:yes gene_type:complete
LASVIIRLKGGLGNQLFIYSFGLYISRRLQYKLKIDTISGFVDDRYNRSFQLEKSGFIKNTEISEFSFSFFNKLERKLQLLLGFRLRNIIYINEDDCVVEKVFNVKKRSPMADIFIEGYFQKSEFVLPILPILSELYEMNIKSLMLKSRKSVKNPKVRVAVHIREFQQKDSMLLIEYYKRSVDYLTDQISGLEFHIFSEHVLNDNIKNIFLNHNHIFHEVNENDFFKIGCFDHIITANSTFSWWIAALSYYKKGIIIMPDSIHNLTAGNWNSQNLLLPGCDVINV